MNYCTIILLTCAGAYVVWVAYAIGISVGESGTPKETDIWGRPK